VASHARTVARAFGPRIDLPRWHRFLRGLPAGHAEGTFFEGIQAIPSGSIFTIDLTRPGVQVSSRRRYWTLSDCVADPGDRRSPAALKDELASLLESSTRDHLIADREVGCLLSGGLDSSIVTCLAARELERHAGTLTCYSIVYDDPRMSEWPFIQSVAGHARCRPVTHRLTPAEAFALVDDVVAAQGEPLLGQDAIAHYRLYGLAREHGCVVALEGHAADELFAGLPLYEGVMFREWLASGSWGRLLREARLRAAAQSRPLPAILREYTFGLAGRHWRTRKGRHAWLAAAPLNGAAPPASGLAAEQSADPSRLNRYLFDLVRHTNLPVVLQLQDRNAMAHGVENRPPYLDHRLVEWAFRLPASAKVGEGRRKRVLWDVARDIVPPLVFARTHKRAIVSRGDWMPLRTAHRTELAAMAESSSLRQAPYVDATRMTAFVHDYLEARHDDAASVWRLYTAWRWLERFRPA
jgi:asparagine synthase (glutamine-hydrolysing)